MQRRVLKNDLLVSYRTKYQQLYSLSPRIPIFDKATLTSKSVHILRGCPGREGNGYKVYKEKKV